MSQQTFTEGMTGTNLVSYLNSNFTQLYNNSVVNAKDYGFLPSASAAANTAALQAAILGGNKTVFIDYGTYEVNDTILVDSNTTIIATSGFKMKKMANYCQVFLNRGALTREYNENIVIDGLEIVVNGKEPYSTLVSGLNGNLCFYYIKNLLINNFKCSDGGTTLFMIHIVRWENIKINNPYIKSGKDGINLGTGHEAIIQDYICETSDDNALFCAGFPQHTVEIGDVYNVKYINCIDRTPEGQSEGGYFCRAMTASWADWTNGNTYKAGEICLNAGKLYQVQNANYSHVATNAPVHTTGIITGDDTIQWKYMNDCSVYKSDIYNISFINCTHYKKRPVINANLYIDAGIFYSAATPGTESLSSVYNVSIIGGNIVPISAKNNIILSDGTLKDIKIDDSVIDNCQLYYNNGNNSFARNVYISINGNHFKTAFSIATTKQNGENLIIQTAGNTQENLSIGNAPSNGATIRMNGIDIPLKNGDLAYLTPVVGDIIRYYNGLMIYKAGGWVNLAI